MFVDGLVMHCLIAMQFSRTVVPDTSKGPALIAFMQHYEWREIIIISSTESLWFEARQGLVKQLEAASYWVLKPAAFEPDGVKDAMWMWMLSEFRHSGIRIVFVLAYDDDVHTLASPGHRESMTTGWAWLISTEGTSVPAMAGWLSFRPRLSSDMQSFAKQVSDYSKSHFDITVRPESVDLAYSVALYDAIMLYAHAATKVLSEGDNLRDGVAVTKAMQKVTFAGVGGSTVALDSKGNRIEAYEMMNYVREVGDVLSRVAVGVFSATLKEYKAYEQEVVWSGNSTLVPLDYVSGDDACCRLSHFCISIDMSAVVACSDLAMWMGLRRAVF